MINYHSYWAKLRKELLISVGVCHLSICYLNQGIIRTRIYLFGQMIP